MSGENGCRYFDVDVGLGQVMEAQRSLKRLFTDNHRRPCTP